jgi:hypothetical protein
MRSLSLWEVFLSLFFSVDPSNIKSDTHLPPRTRLSGNFSFIRARRSLWRLPLAWPLLKAIKQAFIGHYGQDATLILI